jgi:hypothetical protein
MHRLDIPCLLGKPWHKRQPGDAGTNTQEKVAEQLHAMYSPLDAGKPSNWDFPDVLCFFMRLCVSQVLQASHSMMGVLLFPCTNY